MRSSKEIEEELRDLILGPRRAAWEIFKEIDKRCADLGEEYRAAEKAERESGEGT